MSSTRPQDHKAELAQLKKLWQCPVAWAPARPGGWSSEQAQQACCLLDASLFVQNEVIYAIHTCRRFQWADPRQPCYGKATSGLEQRIQACCVAVQYRSAKERMWRADAAVPALCLKRTAAVRLAAHALDGAFRACTKHGDGSGCLWGELCPKQAKHLQAWVRETTWERATPRLRAAHAQELATQTCLGAREDALAAVVALQQAAWLGFHDGMAAKDDAMPAVRSMLRLCHGKADSGKDGCLLAVLKALGSRGGKNVKEKHVWLLGGDEGDGMVHGAAGGSAVAAATATGVATFAGDHIADKALEIVHGADPALVAFGRGRSYTLTAWVRTRRGGPLVSKTLRHGAWAAGCAVLFVDKGGFVEWWGGRRGGRHVAHSTSAVNDGRWHHVAVASDADARTVRLYVDGAFEKQQRLPPPHQPPPAAAATHTATAAAAAAAAESSDDRCAGLGARVKLGHAARTYPTNAAEYFKGQLQRVAYWERALLGWEVEALVRKEARAVGNKQQ